MTLEMDPNLWRAPISGKSTGKGGDEEAIMSSKGERGAGRYDEVVR